MIGIIAQWTIRQRLRTWSGWLGIIGSAILNSLVFWVLLSESSNPALGTGLEVHQALMPQYLSTMGLLFVLLSPVLSMNSIAGEIAEGRWTLYQTIPVSNLDIVLGKWLGLCAYSGLMLLTTMPNLFWLSQYADILWGRWLIGYFGIGMLSLWLNALGIWMSSRCQRPWTAWMASAGISLTLWFLGSLKGTLWATISPMPKIQEVLDGWISLADGLFWTSTIVAFLYWTQDAVAEKYWRHPRSLESRIQPWMWGVVLCLLNVVGLRYNQYWDVNPVRQTLLNESIEMLKNVETPVAFSIQMSPQDPRRSHLEKWLRSVEHLDTVQIQHHTQMESGLHREDGLYIQYNEQVESLTGAIYPNTIHQSLMTLLDPTDVRLCITQGGGEPNLFDVFEQDGIGLWTEMLLKNGYTPHGISGHNPIDDSCELIAIVGRQTPLAPSWLEGTRSIPTLLLLDPTHEAIPPEWLSTIGVIVQDDFVVEPNPQFQIANNPTTLIASKFNLQPHPTLKLDTHQVLLQTMRSIQWNPKHTQHLGLEVLHASSQSWAEVDYQEESPEPTANVDVIGRVPIVVDVSTLENNAPRSNWIVVGTSSLVRNHLLERNPFNGHFALQMLQHLKGDAPQTYESTNEDVRISLSPAHLTQFIWLWIIGLPLGLVSVFSMRRWGRRTK